MTPRERVGFRRRSSPLAYVLAWLGLMLPILAWVSQALVVLLHPHWPATAYTTAAAMQACFLFGAAGCSVASLIIGRHRGAGVIVPAIIGLVLFAGTLLLIAIVATAALFG